MEFKILVVEDDHVIRINSAETLRDAGLVVMETETTDEALAILRAGASEVAVVFSDIQTPGELNGVALAKVIEEEWPEIPIVLTSGQVIPQAGDLPATAHFIPKPYSMASVTALITNLAALAPQKD